MARPSWPWRFGVTVERARNLAETLDAMTDRELAELRLDPPHKVLSQIRAYLLRRSEKIKTRNNPIQLLRFYSEADFAQIDLGPSIDKGSTPLHFHFDSGARLSFGLTLREVDGRSQIVSFRYHYAYPDGQSPQYLRFDLNQAPHTDPLTEPRCHFHPGIDDVRIPFSVHNPIEILDRIFFVLESMT
jgi:hypothetical protein